MAMQKVVNGKRYDTEKAEQVCTWGSEGRSDFSWHTTSLYRTPKGNWFTAGEGGPMSEWRRRAGDSWTGGSGLDPIDSNEARELLEKHGTPEQNAQHFAVEDA
jgi:hypothetical protein